MNQFAQIIGKVEYREGDGINMVIPLGPCEVEEALTSVTISWRDGNSRGSAAIPIAEYKRYLSTKTLRIEDAPSV